MSKLITCVTPLMSRPRAATSVANISGASFAMNFASACRDGTARAHVVKWIDRRLGEIHDVGVRKHRI